jgi:hypothetical protein
MDLGIPKIKMDDTVNHALPRSALNGQHHGTEKHREHDRSGCDECPSAIAPDISI